MKRMWRIGRVVLAVSLLSVATIVVTFWPKQPLWRASLGRDWIELLSIDEERRKVLVAYHGDEGEELRSYDLDSGKLLSSDRLNFPRMQELDAAPTPPRRRLPWSLILSPDCRTIVASSCTSVEHFALALPPNSDCVLLRHPDREKLGLIDGMGFSSDGSALVLHQISGSQDHWWIWDLRKGETYPVAHMGIPSLVTPGGFIANTAPTQDAHLTSDRRFLASCQDGKGTVLLDLVTKREVLSLSTKAVPRFTSDGAVLLVLPVWDLSRDRPQWFRLQSGSWRQSQETSPEFAPGEFFVGFGAEYFATAVEQSVGEGWIGNLPTFLQTWARQIWQPPRLKISMWSLHDGKLLRSCVFPYGKHKSIYPNDSFAENGCEVIVSNVGRFFAVHDGSGLSVWLASPRRPLSCWLTCGGLALLAAWVGWPRKGKVDNSKGNLLASSKAAQ
jgi:hypothetical protein